MAMCLYDVYVQVFEKAKAVYSKADPTCLDALWDEAYAMRGLQQLAASQALEDVVQRLPRCAHIHFCRIHNLKDCPGRVTESAA